MGKYIKLGNRKYKERYIETNCVRTCEKNIMLYNATYYMKRKKIKIWK